jgi:hypothetical protein
MSAFMKKIYKATASRHPPSAEAFCGGRSSPRFRTGHPGSGDWKMKSNKMKIDKKQ